MEILSEYKKKLLNLLSFIKKEKIPELLDKIRNWKSSMSPVYTYVSIPVVFYFLWTFMFSILPAMQETALRFMPEINSSVSKIEIVPGTIEILLQEEKMVKRLDKAYSKYSTSLPYLIVNTSDNTFTLFNNGKLVREGLCSTGSFVLLDAGGEQKWMFETPKGMMRIQGKTESPVWRKPDWAFIEEGLPVPKHHNSHERYESGVLGDYALSIGNGYLIHGTLYQRLLGMPVTHGCVRLGDADLEKVFHTLRVGSKVYIF